MKGKLKRAVETVLKCEGLETSATVSLVLCDDRTIRELNIRYLGHDYPTDVLSFPLSEGELLVGEIIISVETAERNAKRFRQTLEQELLRLAIHGTLHLLGYDDATSQQRKKMGRKERKYLKLTGA
ncbi:MAG: rRNA maturation RNase YbeY [Armatimonadota bacterium]